MLQWNLAGPWDEKGLSWQLGRRVEITKRVYASRQSQEKPLKTVAPVIKRVTAKWRGQMQDLVGGLAYVCMVYFCLI